MKRLLAVVPLTLVLLTLPFLATNCGLNSSGKSSPLAPIIAQTSDSSAVSPNEGPNAAAPAFCWSWKFPFYGSWQVSCKYDCGYHTGVNKYAVDWNLPGDADFGKPVPAPASGWQVWSGENTSGYGKSVVVDAGNGFLYRLAHLNTLSYPYQTRYIRQGEVLGTCGKSGNATGPHVHFSVHYPASYAGNGAINGSSVPQEGISGQWTLYTGSYYPSYQ